MSIKNAYLQFLARKGVPHSKADAIAAGIERQLQTRKPLSSNQSALSVAFLNRPDANKAVDQQLAQAVQSTSAAAGKSNLKVWGDPHENAKGGTVNAWPSQWKMASMDGKGNDVLNDQDIRALADRIASSFGTTVGGSPNV